MRRSLSITVILALFSSMLSPVMAAACTGTGKAVSCHAIVADHCDRPMHQHHHHGATAPEALPKGVVQGAYLRALGAFVFLFSTSLTHCYLRRVTGEPLTRRRTRPRLPCQCIAAISQRARPVASRRDKPRQGASLRHRLSRSFHREAARRMPQ